MAEPGGELDGTGIRHEIDVRFRRGVLDLNIQMSLRRAWTVLFAPSGTGKTTVLRLIAGLQRPDAGRISRFEGGTEEVLEEVERGVSVASFRRGVRAVPQAPALFPHRTVAWNVLFGRKGGEDGLREVYEICRIEHLRGKRPGELSGGERQRVALARAVAADGCKLLLLDEAFSGLDVRLRDEVIEDLHAYLCRKGTPVLQVTHDLGEVFAARAEVARMEDGKIVQTGTAHEVLAREREALLARLKAAV